MDLMEMRRMIVDHLALRAEDAASCHYAQRSFPIKRLRDPGRLTKSVDTTQRLLMRMVRMNKMFKMALLCPDMAEESRMHGPRLLTELSPGGVE